MKNIVLTITAFLLFASAAIAQGSIEGTITDANGKGVANVSVTVVGANGKSVATVKTDEDGYYTFDEIDAGKYRVAAYGAKGLDSAFQENVVVEDDDVATVDLKLAAESKNGGKTQTKPAWPTVKFSFEVDYIVDGKTYKFIAQEVTGLSDGSDPVVHKPGNPAPGIKKYGSVTVKKALFKTDLFSDDKGVWDLFRRVTGPGSPRGTITIRLLDERADTGMSWTLANAFISKIVGDPAAIESMTISHEGLALAK